jgi:hypothetical protein
LRYSETEPPQFNVRRADEKSLAMRVDRGTISLEMNTGDRTWNVSVRSRKDQDHVVAANAREADGRLIFTDLEGTLKGSCYLTDVQGYSVEPQASTRSWPNIIYSSDEDLNGPATDARQAEIWNVSIRSKKEQHRVEAADVKEDGGKLIFTDLQGNLAGCFLLAEVQSWLVAPATGINVIVDRVPGKPGGTAE